MRMVCFNLLLFGIEVVWEQKLSFGNKTLDKSQKNVILVLRRRRTYASKSNRKNSIFFI